MIKAGRVLALVAIAGLMAVGGEPLRVSRPSGPNVLVIVTDDQRADTLSAMPKTKALIADKGVRFKNAIVTTPLCCPSRASIYSGLFAHNHGVWYNDNGGGHLDTNDSVQAVAQDHGYFTAHVDRYMNNWMSWTQEPPDFDLYAVQLGDYAWAPFDALVNGRRTSVEAYTTHWIENRAINFLERFETWEDARPWLTFVTTRAPHLPALPEDRYQDFPVGNFDPRPVSDADRRGKSLIAGTASAPASRVTRQRRDQLRSLRSVDDMVARLVSRLQALGELRDTLIIFTSDNGNFWGEHGLEGKRWPYDETLRVPMLMRWDGGSIPSGVVRSDVVANIDIAPTIYDAAGIKPPYVVDGRSLLSGARREEMLVEYAFESEVPEVPHYLGVWTPGEVFLRFPNQDRQEFYAADDRHQLRNLYYLDRGPDPAPYLARLRAWSRCSGRACP